MTTKLTDYHVLFFIFIKKKKENLMKILGIWQFCIFRLISWEFSFLTLDSLINLKSIKDAWDEAMISALGWHGIISESDSL